MKVELLKNKQTSIIEKIIINKGIKHHLSDLPFNLTHEQTMIELDAYDLAWHELIMDYSIRTNPIGIRSKLYKEFDNREIDYLITILDSVHHNYFNKQVNDEIEQWFFNYYIWAVFYLMTNKLRKEPKGKTKIKVVDPMILLFVDGIESLTKYKVFYDGLKAKDLFKGILIHNFKSSYQELHIVFSKHQYNNEQINLEIFKKEVMKLHAIKDEAFIFWNSKKVMIKELLIDLIKEKIHYA